MNKKIGFLATTALVASGFASGPALAGEPVKLGLGGFYKGAMGAVIGEDSGDGEFGDYRRGHAFKQDIEVYFLGETTLDNGLTVGARIELEGETDGDQIDAAYAYVEGGFGQIRFGDHTGAMGTMCETAPTASSMFGADSPSFNFSNVSGLANAGTNGTCGDISGKATKISYFSPDFAGFSFGVSYTPDDAEDNETPSSGTGDTDGFVLLGLKDNDPESEILSIAANYQREFGEVGTSVGVGWERAFDREHVNPVNSNTMEYDGINDYTIYRVHASVTYRGFTIGGAWMGQRNLGLPYYSIDAEDTVDGIDINVWSLGATYAWDAYSVGLGYSYGSYDTVDCDMTHCFEDGDAGLHIVSLTGSYRLGPGISLDGMVGYNDYNGENHVTWENHDYDAFEVGFGLAIDF